MATPNNTLKTPVPTISGIPASAAPVEIETDIHPDLVNQPAPALEPDPVVPAESVAQTAPEPTPSATSEPDATLASKKDVSINDFLDLENLMPGMPRASEVKKPEVTTPTAPATLVATPPAERDYTPFEAIFGKDKIDNFKKMGNDAFNALSPKLQEFLKVQETIKAKEEELAKLREGRVPDSYYENPKAFVLTQEFEEAVTEANTANAIVQHWQNQLAKVRSGEEEYHGLAYNDKGEIVLTAPIKITPQEEARIMASLSHVQSQASNAQARVRSIESGFVNKHREAVANLQAWEQKAFGAFDKPEVKPIVEDTVKSLLHPVFHNNPLARSLAKLFLVNNALVQKLKAVPTNGAMLPKQVNGKPINPQDIRAAGPVQSAGPAHAASSVVTKKAPTIEDFEKEML